MEELFIFGEHYEIETNIGICHFVKVKDYPKFVKFMSFLYFEKAEGLKGIAVEHREKFNQFSLLEMINGFAETFPELLEGYKKLFEFIFHEDVFHKIQSNEDFEFYINLIKEMNKTSYEKPNPNPEIEYYNNLERVLREKNGEVITFKAIITSVGLYVDPFELTIYQLYAWFDRITCFKNNDATTLFNTVTNSIPIIPWHKDTTNKTTSLTEKDKEFMDGHMTMIPNQK